MSEVRTVEPATPEEARRLRQVLKACVNRLATKLIAQGVSRRLVVRLIDETVKEMYGDTASAIDIKAMMGETEG